MPGFKITGDDGPGLINPSTGDWLRSHRFRLLEFFLEAPADSFLMLRDATLPDKVISELKVQTPSTTYKFAKSVEYTDLKLTFYGSLDILERLLVLADKAHNLGNGIGDYHEYKGVVKFIIYGDGLSKSGMRYTFKNAWISNITHGQLSYGTNDLKTIDVNIKTDFFEVEVVDEGPTKIVGNDPALPKRT